MLTNFIFFVLTFKQLLQLFLLVVKVVQSDNFEILSNSNAFYNNHNAPLWMHSGKFQGDIDGVDAESVKQKPNMMYNALKNRDLTWTNGIIPYELDEAFTPSEVKLLKRAFKTYRKLTCIRFRIRSSEQDFLNIIKGHGCYSQVGKTGGKQEISLGRGCLFNETIMHELMHSIGFWHEHSRSDRNEHIIIQWENIAPGMDSQFDIVSPAIQDALGERYDYRSIMHYGSSAFSKNGRNTIEAVKNQYTGIIGTANNLSELDIAKINKLYRCTKKETKKYPSTSKQKHKKMSIYKTELISVDLPTLRRRNNKFEHHLQSTTVSSTDVDSFDQSSNECKDHFVDCPNFKDYCHKLSFFFIMKSYCPLTCGQCKE